MCFESDQAKKESSDASCTLRWSGITKSVKIVEDNSGLMKNSIAGKTPGESKGSTTKVILNNISGFAPPGEILALMGPSGSGKTSLLDSISGRSAFQEGTLTVNGVVVEKAMMKKFKRKVAYIKQADSFFTHLTVRDQLTYTALLRLPSTQTKAEKHAEVNRIINLLRLNKCAESPIRLLSGGEKKRVNIGTELLTDPQVILLDEPTSGLDSTSAVALLRMLHDLAKNNGKTIITSIHQPSSAVFRAFDKLIMLAEGNVVYFGTPMNSLTYLQEKNIACPSGYNAADHWMDLLVVDNSINEDNENDKFEEGKEVDEEAVYMPGQSKTRQYLIDSWDEKTQAEEVLKDMKEDLTTTAANTFLNKSGKKFNNTWMTQFLVLNHRAMKNARSAVFTRLNLIKSGLVGLIMGLIFFQLPYTERTVTDRDGFFFFTMTYWVFDSQFDALLSFPSEALIINKERSSGSYHLSAYFLAKSFSEVPTRMALPTIYMIIAYYLAGINNNFWTFLGTLVCALLAVMSGESIGLLVGATVPNFEEALVVLVILSVLLMLVGGFFVRSTPMFMSWFKYFSPFKYAFDASRQLIFSKPVPCDGSGVLKLCEGDVSFVTPLQLKESLRVDGSFGFNIGMLVVLFLLPRYFAYLAIRRKKPEERT